MVALKWAGCPSCGAEKATINTLLGNTACCGVPSVFSEKYKEDLVNHPPHYTNDPSGVECIQVTRHMNFNLGNAMKYIWRAGKKGDVITDLKKAVWYLNDEINRLEKERKQNESDS